MFTLLQEKVQEVAATVVEKTSEATANVGDAANEVAQTAPQGGSSWSFWIMIIAMIAIMYFFMWRPESKRRKEAQKFRDGLKAGDKVITAGGIYAVVKKVEETSLLIEVDSNVTLRIDKGMVVAAPQTSENK
jgi:preprotein translocase subunit YajC